MSGLVFVTALKVPPSALRHRNVRAAHLVAKSLHDSRENVIGTANHKGPVTQLYGWCNSVGKHTDNTGYIYFVPLLLPRYGSLIYIDLGPSFNMTVGAIYRLDDYMPHGSYEHGPVVCLMRGPYTRESDGEAIVALDEGMRALAAGEADAPRVTDGYHFPIKNECWVHDPDAPGCASIATRAASKHHSLMIVQCGKCDEPAFKLDHHFPFHQDGNLCFEHFTEDMRQ